MKDIYGWVNSYVSGRTKKPLGPHGKNNYIIAVKWLLKRSALIGLPPDEMAKLKKFKAEHEGRYVEAEDLYRILSYAPTRAHELAFLLIYETGMRPHEALSLTADHVEERSDDVVLIKIPDANPVTPSGRNKTGGRTVIVREHARQLLAHCERVKKAAAKGDLPPARRLFPFKHAALSVAFSRMKRQQRKESTDPEENFKGRLYDLRHAAITNLYLLGLSDQEVRKLAGWTPSSKMPNVYVHVHVNHVIDTLREREQLRARMTT